jgi:hypothetical protein
MPVKLWHRNWAAMRRGLGRDGRITGREYRARSAPIGDDETLELIIDGWETK